MFAFTPQAEQFQAIWMLAKCALFQCLSSTIMFFHCTASSMYPGHTTTHQCYQREPACQSTGTWRLWGASGHLENAWSDWETDDPGQTGELW